MGGEVLRRNHRLSQNIERLTAPEMGYTFQPLTAPLTSTSWDGDAFSTTAKTLIDLSAVFSAPAGIKAILINLNARDSGSAAGSASLRVSPNSTAGQAPVVLTLDGFPNDTYVNESGVCPCDSNGDIYYQITATGAGTMDVTLQIWGYWK